MQEIFLYFIICYINYMERAKRATKFFLTKKVLDTHNLKNMKFDTLAQKLHTSLIYVLNIHS